MRRSVSFVTPTLMFLACIFFLWMFFAAATLERTADLGWVSTSPGRDARALAFDFAARWRHGMSGNSALYMPGFFCVAIASWFWCARKSFARTIAEGMTLVGVAAVCAALLAPYAAQRIVSEFIAREGVSISQFSTSGTWIASAQGIYSLLTWTTLIIASSWSIRLRSPKPLLVPIGLNLILAFVRPWTVADFTSQWIREALAGEPAAVMSVLLVPAISVFIAWFELRRAHQKTAIAQNRTSCQNKQTES
jgi:hypothetical protein